MSAPTISIIIPCRNAGPWLAQTLDSAFSQTWRPLEVILVDDGSTDRSWEVASRFEKHGLRLLRGPGKNASAARNLGLSAATGSWIQFLDADDLLAPDKLSLQMHELLSAPAGTVASSAWARFEGDPSSAHFSHQPPWRDYADPLEYLQLTCNEGWMMQPGVWLCPRPVLNRAGPWDEQLTINDDGEYFCRVILASSTIRFVPGARVYYRTGHPGQLSAKVGKEALQSIERSLHLTATHMLSARDDASTRQAAANLLWKLAHDLHPGLAGASRKAEAEARKLAEPTRAFECGERLRPLVRLLGWRNAKSLQHLVYRNT